MSLRLIFVFMACGMALAHNVDRFYGQKAAAWVEANPTVLLSRSAVHPVERRHTPDSLVNVGTDSIQPHPETEAVDNKQSLNDQHSNVAAPGCCG